jgi:pseudouridine-5'-phosphate glycosidase/pseudouridine kinase
VSRGFGAVGGLLIRHFPAEVVAKQDIVSVNGVGDTFLGVLLAGVSRGQGIGDEVIGRAQKAAALTLGSRDSVSPLIGQ